MNNTELEACKFAVKHHGDIGHCRKYTGEPYINHCAEVVALVRSVPHTTQMLCAAWMHDTVEDTYATLSDIRELFDAETTDMVEMLTDVSRPEDGKRAIRKAIDRDHLSLASPGAKTVKLADVISNGRSIFKHDPGFAVIYIREMQLLLPHLKEGDPTLYAIADALLKDYEQQLKAYVELTHRKVKQLPTKIALVPREAVQAIARTMMDDVVDKIREKSEEALAQTNYAEALNAYSETVPVGDKVPTIITAFPRHNLTKVITNIADEVAEETWGDDTTKALLDKSAIWNSEIPPATLEEWRARSLALEESLSGEYKWEVGKLVDLHVNTLPAIGVIDPDTWEGGTKTYYRHVKSGGIYSVVCTAKCEADGTTSVVYRNISNGLTWHRPYSEFADGRFIRV